MTGYGAVPPLGVYIRAFTPGMRVLVTVSQFRGGGVMLLACICFIAASAGLGCLRA